MTSQLEQSPWILVREIGVEYGSVPGNKDFIALNRPIMAERLDDGGHLIIDDTAAVQYNPFEMQCRTILLSANGRITYDTKAHRIDDGYGCSMANGCLAMLRRTLWDIVLLSPDGASTRRIDLSSISKRPPRIFCCTEFQTFLITFGDGIHQLDIAEVDQHGKVIWHYNRSDTTVGIPGSLQLLPNGSILIADEFHHVIVELQRNGTTAIRYGKWHHPSVNLECLYHPRWAQQLDDGTLLVADKNNHRVLIVGPTGQAAEIQPENQTLMTPMSVSRLRDGNLIVADGENRWVMELDRNHSVIWNVGEPRIKKRLYSFPRSVQYLGDSHYLVADTANDRIVEVNYECVNEHLISNGHPLFWPRSAWMTPERTILIADGRNSRVMELGADGQILHQLTEIWYGDRRITLGDPHHLRRLPNSNLLVVDSALNLVFETSWNGRAVWLIGPDDIDMNDPHSAQLLPDGRVVIADTRNHRVLFVNPKTKVSRSIDSIEHRLTSVDFNFPRFADITPDGQLLIVDSGNNCVWITTLDGDLIWELTCIPDSPIPSLNLPRWAEMLRRNELLVSDHSHHRILHLRRRHPEPAFRKNIV